jgi:hypothetical protein
MKPIENLAAWITHAITDFPVTEDYVKAHYGFDGYGCGSCQTKVPCESKIPTRQDVE